MTLDNFNVVLLGENFPVGSIDLDDFQYLGQPLRETLRVPVALQAEAEAFRMQILPERFEVSALRLWDSEQQAEALMALSQVFLEYVGRRTVRAVGHNFRSPVPDSARHRSDIFRSLVNRDRLSDYLQSTTAVTSELNFFFRRGEESRARLLMNLNTGGDVLLDFNFHYEVSAREGTRPERAIREFTNSMQHAVSMIEGFSALLPQGENASD